MHDIATQVLERHAQAGTWWLDQETGELWWSAGVYNIHGVDPDRYTPALDTAVAFYLPESRVKIAAAIEAAIANGSDWSLTLDIRRADGEIRHIHTLGRAELRQNEAPLLAGAIFDVHERVVEQNRLAALEDRLAEHDMRWRVASENAGLGLIEIDLGTDRYRVYGAFARRIGLSGTDEVQISGARWLTYVHPQDRETRQQELEAHIAGEKRDYAAEYRLCLPKAEPIWVAEAGRLAYDDTHIRIIGTLADISERKRSEAALQRSQHRLRLTLRNAPIGIALVSLEGRWLNVNRALCDIIGYSEAELLATTFQQLTPPEDLEDDLAHVKELLAGRIRAYRIEKRYVHKRGHLVDIQLDVTLLRDEDGEPLYFISQIQDITERKRAHQALFEANDLAEVTFESISEGVIRIDRHGVISQANSAARTLLGAATETLVGRPFADAVTFFDADQDSQLPDPLANVLVSGKAARVPIFTRLKRQDGRTLSIVDSISPIHDHTGAVRGAVFVFQDVSEARQMTQELTHQVQHDPLTGLPNRRGFESSLARTWQRVRSGVLHAFVMYLDLDHFKAVNDTCGHAAGDELLRQIALGFRAMLRESDVLARLGGDEFAAVIHARDADGAMIVADKFIRTAAELNFRYAGQVHGVGVSIGVAALDPTLESAEAALVQADTALYAAKAGGRNCCHLFEAGQSSGERAMAYLDTATLLRRGFEQDGFALYLQTMVDTDGAAVGYEVLLRLVGPEHLLEPDAFLSTAKRLGMMSRIDRWVVTCALSLVEAHARRGSLPANACLSINLSPVSMADPTFHAELIALLDLHRAEAHRIIFEITESDALFGEHYPQLIRQLRERGFRVWLDDFAGGHNGFDVLRQAQVDGIKIDRGFVRQLEHDPINRAVLRAIVDVSRELSLQVTAEGVESAAAWDLLRKAGVGLAQGYHFHRPAPVDAVLAAEEGSARAKSRQDRSTV